MIKHLSLITLAANCTLYGHTCWDEMEDDYTDRYMEERQREYEEQEKQRQEQERTEHWREEDGDDVTYWSSPRKLEYFEVDLLSSDHRKRIYYQIVDLKTQAMSNLNKARDLRYNIPDVEVKSIFTAIITDCVMGCVRGFPVATCITCISELSSAACQKTSEFYEAQGLVRASKALYEEAERLEELLWYDDNAEDWM